MLFTIIIQARCCSSRFPNKVLKKIKKKSLLEFMIERLSTVFLKKKIIVATTLSKKDNKLVSILKKKKINFFRGSEDNVLKRYINCCTKFNVQNVVHLTSDCPLVDLELLDRMIRYFKKNKFDYLSNTYPPSKSTYPDGTDIEIYKFSSLKKLAKLTSQKEDKEHVTNFFWKNPTKFKTYTYKNKYNISNFKYSIDYKNELGLIKEIVKYSDNNKLELSAENIVKIIKKNKKLKKISLLNLNKFKRNRKDLYPIKQ